MADEARSGEVSSPGFWNDRYLSGETGWDKGRAAPPIARMLSAGLVSPGRVAVLGAGRGHEALALARHGFQVTAVDFAEEACRAVREAARKASLQVEALQVDLFELPRTRAGRFDAVLEHTCFCAIDPARRPEYVTVVERLLAPGGVLFGLFFAHGRPGGPPFTTSEEELRALFSPGFSLERLTRAPDSFPERHDAELEFLFRALPAGAAGARGGTGTPARS